MKALPDKLIEKLFARIHVEGVIQTSKENLVKAILEELSKPSDPLSSFTEGMNRMTEQQETIISRLNAGCDVNCHGDASRGQRFFDLSQLRPVTLPANFTYPSYSVFVMWELWRRGREGSAFESAESP